MLAPHALSIATGALLVGALTSSCLSTRAEPLDPGDPVEEPRAPGLVVPDSAEMELADGGMSGGMPNAMPMTPRLTGEGVFYVLTDDPTRPLARYSDGQLSINDSCAIRLDNKLNRKIPPVYVNGSPIGFC